MASSALISLCVALTAITMVTAADSFYNEEMKLFSHLTESNNLHIRPVSNHSQKIDIKFGVAIIKIMEVDEIKGTISLQVWQRHLWKDQTLTWTPSDYGGVDHIRIPSTMIWKPDITLFNSASPNVVPDAFEALAVISSDGTVLWIPSVIYKVQCSFDMKNFPFDEQTCSLKFGSWTYDGNKINPEFYDNKEDIDVAEYLGHMEWEVKETKGKKNVKYYPCCEEPYPDLTFTLHLRRISNYLGTMYLAPPVLVSILLPFIFMLPVLNAGRYFAAVGGLIVMTIQIQNLHKLFPEGELTLLGTYHMGVFALNFLVLWVAILVTSVANRAHTNIAPPAILKTIFINGLGRVCCVSRQSYKNVSERDDLEVNADGADSKISPGSGGAEWLTIARVLDRFFLIITLVLVIILAIACIPK